MPCSIIVVGDVVEMRDRQLLDFLLDFFFASVELSILYSVFLSLAYLVVIVSSTFQFTC